MYDIVFLWCSASCWTKYHSIKDHDWWWSWRQNVKFSISFRNSFLVWTVSTFEMKLGNVVYFGTKYHNYFIAIYVLDKKMYEYGIYVKMNRDFACNGPHIQIPSISCLDKTNIRWKRTTKYIHVKTNFMLMLHAR